MYNVYDASEIIYLKDLRNGYIRLIGNEKDLIHFLAKGYSKNFYSEKEDNIYFNRFVLSEKDCSYFCSFYNYGVYSFSRDEGKYYLFFDRLGRVINPKLYEEVAFDIYCKEYKNFHRTHKMTYGKSYRNGLPAKVTRKYGYRKFKYAKHKQRQLEYSIKEYRMFSKEKKQDLPKGWMCRYECRDMQKSWKKQSKRKHQWKPKNYIENN